MDMNLYSQAGSDVTLTPVPMLDGPVADLFLRTATGSIVDLWPAQVATLSGISVYGARLSSAHALSSPSIDAMLAGAAAPDGLASGHTLSEPGLPTGTALSPATLSSGQSLGQPVLATASYFASAGMASGQSLASPALSSGTGLALAAMESDHGLTPSALTNDYFLLPANFAHAMTLGDPGVGFSITLAANGIASTHNFDGVVLSRSSGWVVIPSAQVIPCRREAVVVIACRREAPHVIPCRREPELVIPCRRAA